MIQAGRTLPYLYFIFFSNLRWYKPYPLLSLQENRAVLNSSTSILKMLQIRINGTLPGKWLIRINGISLWNKDGSGLVVPEP